MQKYIYHAVTAVLCDPDPVLRAQGEEAGMESGRDGTGTVHRGVGVNKATSAAWIVRAPRT